MFNSLKTDHLEDGGWEGRGHCGEGSNGLVITDDLNALPHKSGIGVGEMHPNHLFEGRVVALSVSSGLWSNWDVSPSHTPPRNLPFTQWFRLSFTFLFVNQEVFYYCLFSHSFEKSKWEIHCVRTGHEKHFFAQ